MSYGVAPLVAHTVAAPTWIDVGQADGDRVWFRDRTPDGTTYQLANPATKSLAPAFDHAALATAIAAATPGKPAPDPRHLDLESLAFTGDAITFTTAGDSLRCTLAAPIRCAPAPKEPTTPGRRPHPEGVTSPDGAQVAFIRDWNLWLRDTRTGAEHQLTRDGIENFGYATDNAGWQHTDRAILVWSPDSKRIATFQQDQRKTGEMYLVPVTNTHPVLERWRYPSSATKTSP